MNLLDAAILVAVVGALSGGWRLGFLARLFAWAGVGVGLAVGVQFVPRIVTSFGGTSADDRVTVAVLFLLLAAIVGQAIGLGIGMLVHHVAPSTRTLPVWDRVAGALLGLFGIIVLVWMITPSLATAKGWPARMARGSVVVDAIERIAPEQPRRFAAWGRSISDAPYGSALGPLDDPPDPGEPPTATLPAEVDARVRRSIVKVTGRACRQIQEGSGWVVQPGLIVTNAHVVAGEDETHIEDGDGVDHDATVVVFDPVRDLAVLAVSNFTAPPLRMAEGEVGAVGSVYGHPGGGPLVAAPARIGEEILAVGTDIYRTKESRRHVYVLAAKLAAGDSGGALVDDGGRVVGVAFAIDPGHSGTAYAVTDDEVRPVVEVVERDGLHARDTGRCLVG